MKDKGERGRKAALSAALNEAQNESLAFPFPFKVLPDEP